MGMTVETKRWVARAGALLMLVFSVGGGAAADNLSRGKFDADAWLDGPGGLVKGIAAAERDGRILVVYFYADWCGYCRQFEKEILGTPDFEHFVEANIAVRINPEKGDGERRLAAFYGVRGYPTFFVYGSTSKALIRVERHTFVDGRPELLSPGAFIARITEASTR